jgi:hypothetical protein
MKVSFTFQRAACANFKNVEYSQDTLMLLWALHTYIHTYTYSLTDPSSAQVGLNVEFVMKRAKLQHAIKSNK